MAKHVVAKASEIPEGSRKVVSVKGRPVVVFNIKGEWFALLNRCPHQGGDLSAGALVGLVESDRPGCYSYSREGEILRCPWHGWEFDVRTGKSQCRPEDIRVRRFDVRRESAEEVRDLAVETFDVSVHEDYLVIET